MAHRLCIVALGGGFESALEIIDNREQTVHGAFGTVAKNLAFFFERAFAEVVELRHQEEILFLLLFEFLFRFGKLFGERVDFAHLGVLNILGGFILFGCFGNVVENLLGSFLGTGFRIRFRFILILAHDSSLFLIVTYKNFANMRGRVSEL